MKTYELLIKILTESEGDGLLRVMIDSGAPIPFEECFTIVKGKGFLLFRPNKEKEVSP